MSDIKNILGSKPKKKADNIIHPEIKEEDISKETDSKTIEAEKKKLEVPVSNESKKSNDELRNNLSIAHSELNEVRIILNEVALNAGEINEAFKDNVKLKDIALYIKDSVGKDHSESAQVKQLGALIDEKNTEIVSLRKELENANLILAGFGVDSKEDNRVTAIGVLLDNIEKLAGQERVSIFTNAIKSRLLNLKYDDDILHDIVKDIDKESIEGRFKALRQVIQKELK